LSRDRDDERGERPRRSWREIDKLRDGTSGRRDEPRPRGAAAEARAKSATQAYLKRAGELFQGKGGAEGERLARAVREAQGAELAAACAAYRGALGVPQDPGLLARFLDSSERAHVIDALRALDAVRGRGGALGPGLQSQLRLLAQHADDEIAEAAEALLAAPGGRGSAG
jgi:hypothetical protein